jgi:uncharacterized coiled-coil protein SlyX
MGDMTECAQGAANKKAIEILEKNETQHDQRIGRMEVDVERVKGSVSTVNEQVATVKIRTDNLESQVATAVRKMDTIPEDVAKHVASSVKVSNGDGMKLGPLYIPAWAWDNVARLIGIAIICGIIYLLRTPPEKMEKQLQLLSETAAKVQVMHTRLQHTVSTNEVTGNK